MKKSYWQPSRQASSSGPTHYEEIAPKEIRTSTADITRMLATLLRSVSCLRMRLRNLSVMGIFRITSMTGECAMTRTRYNLLAKLGPFSANRTSPEKSEEPETATFEKPRTDRSPTLTV